MLSFGFSTGDFVSDILSWIFIQMLDEVVYKILAITYRIWVGITKLDLFGGTDAGVKLYDSFSKRIYAIIAIVMVFIFAYRLILYILDPDGRYAGAGGKGGGAVGSHEGGLIKRTVFSIVLILVAPVVFKYMSAFQYHVVSNNTIPNIVLGTEGGNRYLDNGKQLAMITLMSFYHPVETTYNSFVHNTETLTEANAQTACPKIIPDKMEDGCAEGGAASQDLCVKWRDAMREWCLDEGAITPYKIIQNKEIRSTIGDSDGAEYMWAVCTAAGCLVVYFLVSYCISIGTRAVRLGVLEIIAPIPILLRIFDPGNFTPWFNAMKKTYLELFIRIAVISFVIYLCTLVPTFIEIIGNAF